MRTALVRFGSFALVASISAGVLHGQIFVDADATGAGDGSSWADAYTELSDALDSIGQNKTLWVAQGRYTPGAGGASGPSTTFFLPIGTRLFGGFDGTEQTLAERAGLFDTTILSGDHLDDDGPEFQNRADNSRHVVTNGFLVGEIDGFTIAGGNAVGSDGGAIYGPNLGGCPIRNCTFRSNQADNRGGALYMVVSDGLIATNCRFLTNRADAGGAAYVWSIDAGARFETCRFVGNSAYQRGGALDGYWATVENSEFIGNYTLPGGLGGGASSGTTSLLGCTLVHNTAFQSSEGGGALLTSGNLFESSILWGNADDEGTGELSQLRPYFPDDLPLAGVATSCLIQGWTGTLIASTGALKSDPRFVDPLGPDGVPGTLDDDLRLGFGSPAVDAGLDSELAPYTTDVAGQPRFVQSLTCGVPSTVDIGAHERAFVQGTTTFCPQPPTSLGVPIALTGPCFASAGTIPLSAGPVPAGSGTFFVGAQIVAQPFGAHTICAGRRFLSFPGQPNGNALELDFAPNPALAGSSLVIQTAALDGATLVLSDAIVLTLVD